MLRYCGQLRCLCYLYKHLFNKNIRTSRDRILALGSDFPVEGVNPLLGFYAAVKRLTVDGSSPHGPSGW